MKSCTRKLLSLILIILFALSTTQSVPVLAAEGRTAKIYDYSNEVTVTRGKAELKVFKGMRLKEGDTIKTGKSSNAYIEIDSDKVIKLDSSTIVTISNMSGTDENGSINISLSSGKIYNDIKKKLTKNSTYKVRTPNAVMGVRGTTFVVDLKSLKDDSSETVLTVFGGTVAFAPSEQADLNVYVQMNQTANTTNLTEGQKPVITELDSKNMGTFELTEIMKDAQLQKNINKLLNEENKSLEEVLKQAEKQEKELEKKERELEKKEKELEKQENKNQKSEQLGEASNSDNNTTGSDKANGNTDTSPNSNGSSNANGNAGTNPSTNSNASANENAGTGPNSNGSSNANENAGTNQNKNSSSNANENAGISPSSNGSSNANENAGISPSSNGSSNANENAGISPNSNGSSNSNENAVTSPNSNGNANDNGNDDTDNGNSDTNNGSEGQSRQNGSNSNLND